MISKTKYIQRFLWFFLASLAFYSCRKDDICTAGGTPKLGLAFYDFTQPDTLKKVDNLTVLALPGVDTLIHNASLDELKLPLNVNTDSCRFVLMDDQNPDTLQFNYTRQRAFVSKSCGYKIIFHQLTIVLQQDNDLWIKQIDIIKTTVQNDTIHVKILH